MYIYIIIPFKYEYEEKPVPRYAQAGIRFILFSTERFSLNIVHLIERFREAISRRKIEAKKNSMNRTGDEAYKYRQAQIHTEIYLYDNVERNLSGYRESIKDWRQADENTRLIERNRK